MIGKCDGFVHEPSPNGDLIAKPDVARYWDSNPAALGSEASSDTALPMGVKFM